MTTTTTSAIELAPPVPPVEAVEAVEAKPSPSLSIAGRIGVVLGFALHLVAGVFVASSGLLMPAWAVVALGAFWIGALVYAWRHRHHPAVVLAVPFVTFAVWFLTGTLGEALLGWTG